MRIALAYQTGQEISVKLVNIIIEVVAQPLMIIQTHIQLSVKMDSVKMEEHVCIQTLTAHAQMGGKETHVTQVRANTIIVT